MKPIRILILAIASIISLAKASGADWKLHSTFDNYMEKVIDTPQGVYVLAHAQYYDPRFNDSSEKKLFLFRHDKSSDELMPMNAQTGLAQSMVQTAEYNPWRNYLLVVYANDDIEIIYDNGKKTLIPGLRLSSYTGDKTINSITFDPTSTYAYMGTAFGYLKIDDNKGEISESHNYGMPVNSVVPFDGNIFIGTPAGLLFAPADSPKLSYSEFTKMEGTGPVYRLLPQETQMGVIHGAEQNSDFGWLKRTAGHYALTDVFQGTFLTVAQHIHGLLLATYTSILHYDPTGTRRIFTRDEEDHGAPFDSHDLSDFWVCIGRKGLKKITPASSSTPTQWQMTKNYLWPNASNVFISTAMEYHPNYGMLVHNHGIDRNFSDSNMPTPTLLCGLQHGLWTSYAPAYRRPELAMIQTNPRGMAVDPDNTDHVFSASLLHGILRQNLSDPNDILHMSSKGDQGASLPGFVDFAPVQQFWSIMNSFSNPEFDTKGNLWSSYFNIDASDQAEIWVWPRQNKLASKDASSFRPWVRYSLKNAEMTNASFLLPLRSAANANRLLFVPNSFSTPLYLIDHGGAPENTDGYKVTYTTTRTDQDGSSFVFLYVSALYEDVATGLVWIGHDSGVALLNPKDLAQGSDLLTRIKVSRDDGTDLADYLLDGVQVNAITEDGAGRKWFGTAGAGIVCTSSDGRRIIAEYTADSSPLPSDVVYGLGFNPDDNSMMISTDKGLAQLFLSTAGGASDLEQARAYPNPVRPDFTGYVVIDGLTDGALVKITDTAGNLVKELGFASAGTLQWDVTNLEHRRVKTGVYFVLASSGPDDDVNMAKVAKILVVN